MSMDFDSMTAQELETVIDEAKDELARRQSVEALDRQIGNLLQAARDSGVADTPADGQPWVQPTSAADAYLAGDIVSHDGTTWSSLINYNVWAPGVSGWREVAGKDDEGNPVVPEYLAPTGSHDVYMTGDQVTFEGSVYEAVQDNVTWSPSEHPPAWRKVD